METEEKLKVQLNFKTIELKRAQKDVEMYKIKLSAGAYVMLKRAENKVRVLNSEIKQICSKLNKLQTPKK